MGKKHAPPPPDLGPYATAMQQSAEQSNQIAQQQLDWAKQQDSMNRDVTNRVLGVQLPAMQQQAENAQADRARYEQTFQPLQDQYIQEAQNFDTAGRRDIARGQAVGDVNSQFDASRRNALQRLEGFGVDPSQTRNAALDLGVRTQQAAAQAAAATAATQQVQNTGRAMRESAINLGQGLPAQAAQGYNAAVNAGQAANAAGNATSANSSNLLGTPGSWAAQGVQGEGQAANVSSLNYQNQLAAYNAQQQGTGALAGALGQGAGLAASSMKLADGGFLGDSVSGDNSLSPVARIGALGQKYTDPLAWIFGKKWTNFTTHLADESNKVLNKATKPLQKIDQKINPVRRFVPGVDKVASWTEHKPLDTAAIAAGAYFGGGALGNMRGGGGGGGAGGGQSAAQPMNWQDYMQQMQMPGQQQQQQQQQADTGDPGADERMRLMGELNRPLMAAGGGFIGHGPSDGSGVDDQVDAKLSVGEFVIPADVVQKKGMEFFEKLVERYHTPAEQQRKAARAAAPAPRAAIPMRYPGAA